MACAIVAAPMFIPHAWLALYPLALFETFVHEASHALAAVATGGTVLEFVVNADTSGHVLHFGGNIPVVASAGYLGTVIAGAALLWAGRRRSLARMSLLAAAGFAVAVTPVFAGGGSGLGSFGLGGSLLAIALFCAGIALISAGRIRAERTGRGGRLSLSGVGVLIATLVYVSFYGDFLASLIGFGMGALLLATALYASPSVRHGSVIFLGVQLSLGGLLSIRALWFYTTRDLGHSDAEIMARVTGLPASLWALIWGFLSVLVVAGALWLFWRDARARVRSPSLRERQTA